MDTYFELYEEKKDKVPFPSEYAPYYWFETDGLCMEEWNIYGQLLLGHPHELSNSINELGRYAYSVIVWNEAIQSLTIKEKHEVLIQHIRPIATLALLLPYSIRSRFIFSITHLSHQANQLISQNWRDVFPDEDEIYFKDADEYCKNWKSYNKLKPALERIANKTFQEKSKNFRNTFAHRYSPGIEIGIANFATRENKPDGGWQYAIGGTPPLTLQTIGEITLEQHKQCLKAYGHYQKLVWEQINTYKAHNKAN